MDYGYKPTTNGRALIAKCMALEAPLILTRVAVGSGLIDAATNLADVHELISYVTDGTIGERSHKDNRFDFVVQYENSAHPELSTFYLNEFIVYGQDPETGEDVDLLYATLGDYKQPVPAYSAAQPPSVWKFPVMLIVSDEIDVVVDSPAGLITYDALDKAVYTAVQGVGSITMVGITIPKNGWTMHGITNPGYVDYPYLVDVAIEECTINHYPDMALDIASLITAGDAGMCTTVYTDDGYVRFLAEEIPEADLTGVLKLQTETLINTDGSGSGCDCDIATDEEVDDAIDDVYGESDTEEDEPTEEDVPDGYEIATDKEVSDMLSDVF